MAKDPVCGMTVDEKKSIRAERDGKTYYFCSQKCKEKFMTRKAKPSVAPSARKTSSRYTCPMHPEIKQDHPGDCPKCGMAL